MARKLKRRPAPKGGHPDQPRPVGSIWFWTSVVIVFACITLIVYLTVASVPGIIWGIMLLVLLPIFVFASLATSEIKIIPPKGTQIRGHLWKPKVLGQIVLVLLSAAAFLIGISQVFNPPADKRTLDETRNIVVEISNTASKTDETLSGLDQFLRQKFPDDPRILEEISGRWGDEQPACEVVWNIEIVQIGDEAAITAETIKTPDSVQPYRFVGSITKVDANTLHVVGVEPDEARGWAAQFSYNPATQRLSWNDLQRGSGGVEVYKRCP